MKTKKPKSKRDNLVDILCRFSARDAFESPEMKRDKELSRRHKTADAIAEERR